MKKGNSKRVLAGFLALLLVATSFSWNFGETKAAEATENTMKSEATPSVKYDFESITDVSVLDEAFTAHKQGVAEADASVADNWYSAAAQVQAEGVTGDHVSWISGLKTKERLTTTSRRYLQYNNTYKNFLLTVELYADSNTCVIVGNELPSSGFPDENAGSFTVWGSSPTQLNWRGAGKKTSNLTGLKAGTAYTLHIRVENGKLSAWVDGTNYTTSYTVNDKFPETSYITLVQERKNANTSDGRYGAYKSFEIIDLDAEGYANFDNADVSALMDFDSTQFNKTTKEPVAAEQPVSTQWYTGKSATLKVDEETSVAHSSTNVGIKPLADTNDTYNHFFNYNKTYRNFKFSTELYYRNNIGVVLGEKNLYPTSSSSAGIIFWFPANGTLAMTGAVDGSTAKVSGTNTAFSGSGATYNFRFCAQADQPTTGTAVKLNMELVDGKLTITIEGYDAVLTIGVAAAYPERTTIALWTRNYTSNNGGFKSFAVENLIHEYDFTSTSVAELTDFTASQRDKTSKEFNFQNVIPSELWYKGTNNCLKATAGSATHVHFLYYNEKYDNYKATIQLRGAGNIGFVIGAENVYPADQGAAPTTIAIWFPANMTFAIRGAIDGSDYTCTENGQSVTKTLRGTSIANVRYTDTNAKDGSEITAEIEMIDGYLTVSVGYATLKVKVSSIFPAEASIGFWSDDFAASKNVGFESFAIREVEVNTGTTVDVDGYTDFDHVNTAVFDEKGFTATQFNTSGYSVVGEVDQPVSTYWAAGNDVISGNAGLKPKVLASENKMTILNTPYTYTNFRMSTEVYWGANTGIVLGAKNVFPTGDVDSGVRIYFNANQIQLVGGGLDYDSKVVSGNSATWNFGFAPSYIFKPASGFTITKGEVYKLNVEMKDGVLTVWVDGYDGVLTIKTKDTFKQESIALMARSYNGDGGGLKSLKVEELEDIVMSYTAEQFASYRSGDTYTAPEYKDYLFAGWFTDQACGKESAIAADAKTVETTVYAKFVPRYVLDVKAQISAHLSDTNPTDDGTGAIRFVTSIDTLNYSQVGFNISYDKGDGNGIQNKTSASNKVYKELFATIGDTNSETIEYNPKIEFCKTSEFFKACTVRNISADLYDMEFTVTPFWETMDGTIVNGDAVVKTVDQGINSVKLNGKTALFIGDSIQAGHNTSDDQAGYTLKGWAQRLERYGLVSENVAQKGWALTNKDISGRSQIVTQLDSATKTDYDFVILEGGVNDVRIDQDTQNPDITIDWGTINEDPNAAFTDDNIAGAMQDLIVKTQAKFPNAKIVYIINHYFGANATNMKNYVAMVKDACRVHDIDYIDLSDTESYPTLEPLTQKSAEYIPDNLHPSAAGYELSTPIIATCLRKLATGEVADTVYVSAAGTDSKGYGTKENPYQSLNYAVNQVADGGTVYVQGTVASGYNFTGSTGVKSYYLGGAEKDTEKTNAKQITIKGEDATSSLIDFSGAAQLRFNMAVTLENIQVKWPTSRIYAEGNRFTVADTVVQTADSSTAAVFGGSATHDVDRTDVKLYAGDYKVIVGGQVSRNVGETHLTLGKKVNSKADPTSHDFWTGYRVYGGSYSEGAAATVTGDTYVTIEDGAKMNWLFGAGGIGGDNIKTKSVVNGETHVELKGGEVYGIYGGGYSNTAAKTHVVVTGGTVYQIFGGNQEYDMTGDTDVQILGGTIKRRVYGGNYNNYEDGNWKGAFKVTGNTSVAIGPNAVFSFTDNDQGIFACSRYGSAFESEKGTVIFLDNCYNSKNGYLGSQDLAGGIVVGTPKYHYLVNAGTNGKVYAAGNSIKVIPNDGYTAVVTSDGTALEQNADGSYALPDLGSAASKTINVTFNAN